MRAAAAAFGPTQRDAADAWLKRTVAGEGFCTEELLKQKVNLFEECRVDDEGTSKCQALGEALVDLQAAMALELPKCRPINQEERIELNRMVKAALQVRNVATQFGPAQKQSANAWLERALRGESSASLFEESLELFGECELSETSDATNKCIELSKALDALRDALGVDEQR